jgi:hypothetical protein
MNKHLRNCYEVRTFLGNRERGTVVGTTITDEVRWP